MKGRAKMDRATIVGKLHEITDHYLLGSGTWPADRETLPAFRKLLREFGLDEDVPGTPGSTRSTILGREANVDLVMAFVGAWDLLEIPGILESNGYLDEDEMEALWSIVGETIRTCASSLCAQGISQILHSRNFSIELVHVLALNISFPIT